MIRSKSMIGGTVLALSVGLSACGGGGSGAAPPGAPSLTLAFGIKQLQFSWNAASGANHYKLYENPDNASGFTQIGADLTTTSATLDIAVHRHDWANARYLLEACNSAGCTGSNEVNTHGAALQAIGYVKASNTDAMDSFGGAVALSADGNTLAVGAVSEDSNATGVDGDQANNDATFAGAVYVYTRSNGVWVQQAYIKASNTGTADTMDFFGRAVALSADGNTLAVGADGEDSSATGINGNQQNESAGGAGAVYVYSRSNGAWTQQAYIKASNPDAGDNFGGSVALSGDGNTLAVGATGEDSSAVDIGGDEANNDALSAGAVYVYNRSNGVWTQQAYVKASNTNANDQFGFSVALNGDGNTLVVGAPGEDSSATGINGDHTNNVAGDWDSGAVYIYVQSNGVWAHQAYVKASNTDMNDVFGWSVALAGDGDTLAVSASGEASIDGNQANNDAPAAGAVYVYTRAGAAWTQQAYVKASNTDAMDFFGDAVALSADGNTLAVAAPDEASNATGIDGDQANDGAPGAGAVYVYARGDGAWTQQAYVKASNTEAGNQFGASVALSGDGRTLAVAAVREASSATDINGDQADDSAADAGAVYLY